MIEIVRPPILLSIQDGGRYGYQHWGIPISGPMDRVSAALANAVLGNAKDAPVLEIADGPAVLQFHAPTRFALCGARGHYFINRHCVPLLTTCAAAQGDVLLLHRFDDGRFLYLAIEGGFHYPEVLNSRSYYGALYPRWRWQRGTKIPFTPVKNTYIPRKHAYLRIPDAPWQAEEIEVTPGPEWPTLPKRLQNALRTHAFVVSPSSNRVGYRLDGLVEGVSALPWSAPMHPGVVQLTPSGQLIVMMRDGPTTGGYARVLIVEGTALSHFAQKRPGQPVRFRLRK